MTRALPLLVAVVLAVYASIDCLQTDPAEIPGPRRPIWMALIILLPAVGPIAWIIASRLRRRPKQPRRIPPVVAPDDNPEFLREIRASTNAIRRCSNSGSETFAGERTRCDTQPRVTTILGELEPALIGQSPP